MASNQMKFMKTQPLRRNKFTASADATTTTTIMFKLVAADQIYFSDKLYAFI